MNVQLGGLYVVLWGDNLGSSIWVGGFWDICKKLWLCLVSGLGGAITGGWGVGVCVLIRGIVLGVVGLYFFEWDEGFFVDLFLRVDVFSKGLGWVLFFFVGGVWKGNLGFWYLV